ncbi:DUF3060 domain-containing protein [Microbacterium sp. NPDC057407]|uniref:DUF3060 domain-containing protein n=1 Tax=Microbacterium sp. NPDC057407 TaxID=3346120 RepID=UPI003670E72E
MTHRTLLALPLLALLLGAAAGCSAPPADPAPTSSSATAETAIPMAHAKCVDGLAVVTTDSADVTIDGDCATVEIKASNSQVTVGAVENLMVDGSINRIVVAEVDTVHFTADGNVVVTDSTPVVTDDGQHNTVTDQPEM